MSSREIKHLSKDMQVLYNKLHDKVRRDPRILKLGGSMLLVCTFRSPDEQAKLHGVHPEYAKPGKSGLNMVLADGSPASTEFSAVPLKYGEFTADFEIWSCIASHAWGLGLAVVEGDGILYFTEAA